jgi:tetratricopeptide (TPR) repeat protein
MNVRLLRLALTGWWLATPLTVLAQHSIDVQRLAASGEHLRALARFEQLPRRVITPEARIAAARSAWALGLADRAIAEFDDVVVSEDITPIERARIHLSQGIVHFQEGRYQVALVHTDKAATVLTDPSPLRAKVWLLAAEAHARLQAFGRAEEFYHKALIEAAAEDKPDVHFLLGAVQRHLGKLEAARANFEKVPLRHDRTAAAVRSLGEIALETGDYAAAGFWLRRGREEYPDRFLDSWVDYALVRVAAHDGATDEVREIRTRAEAAYAPSDGWLTLLVAESEAYEWRLLKR